MKKLGIIAVFLIMSVMVLSGCDQINVGNKEPTICVPVKDIDKICEQVKTQEQQTTTEIEAQVEEISTEIEQAETTESEVEEVLEQAETEFLNGTAEEVIEEEIVEETIDADYTITEGDLVTIAPKSADPSLAFAYSAPLDENGSWQTAVGDAGVYIVNITASNEEGSLTKQATILVLQKANNMPVIESATVDDITEGEMATVNIIATDADNDTLSFSYSQPFDAQGNWQTQSGDAGIYNITVTVSDGIDTISEVVALTVLAGNNAPVISDAADLTVNETDTITINPTVTDLDGDDITITISDPVGNDGVWDTTYDDAGEYLITITATDGIDTVEETITVTVLNKIDFEI